MGDLLLVASGISAWLAVYNFVVFAMRRERLTLWVALWSTVSFVYQFARHSQVQDGGTTQLAQVESICFVSAVILIPLIFLMIRELTQSTLFPWAEHAFATWLVVALGLHATTQLFVLHTVAEYVNFEGVAVRYLEVGPLYLPSFLVVSLGSLLMGVLMVARSTVLSRREKAVWLGSMLVYQGLGANDLLLFSQVTRSLLPAAPGQSLFEFGVIGMAVALSLRTARRAEISAQQLEQLVERRTSQLEHALTEARAAVAARAAFLASMSHEVRTPLNGIIGLTELLLDDRGLPQATQERLALVLRSGRTLKALVDDVLDFARLDARGLTLSPAVFSPAAALEDVVALFDGTARARGLELGLQKSASLPALVYADEQRLRQIVSNLVNNAVKFTDHGCVRVHSRAETIDSDHTRLVVEVVDTGRGITPEDQARLFRPFSQVGVAMNSPGQGGTGLGLAISRELAQLMGGAITLVSTPGAGSTFTLTIPCEVRSAADHPRLAATQPMHRYQARVLVAEDNPVNRLVTEGLLKSLGLQVVLAVDGREAVVAASNDHFDLIFMDCQMPYVDGFEATRQLRLAGARQPIIALTAYASADDRDACLKSGMTDYLTKPLRRADLDLMLARHLPEGEAHAA